MTAANSLSDLELSAREYFSMVTAYHEAGHVVAALLGALLPKSATICDDIHESGNTFVITWNVFEGHPLYKKCKYSYLQMLAGGLAAEDLFYKKSFGVVGPRRIRSGAYQDWNSFRKVLEELKVPPGKQRQKIKTQVYTEVTELLDSHWESVTAIAAILYQKRKITYRQIKTTLIKNDAQWSEVFQTLDGLLATANAALKNKCR